MPSSGVSSSGAFQEVAVGAGQFDPGYKFTVAVILLVAILLIRPRGLFGSQQ